MSDEHEDCDQVIGQLEDVGERALDTVASLQATLTAVRAELVEARKALERAGAVHTMSPDGWTWCKSCGKKLASCRDAGRPLNPSPVPAVCATCGGSGWVPDNRAPGYSERCPHCKGDGRTPAKPGESP